MRTRTALALALVVGLAASPLVFGQTRQVTWNAADVQITGVHCFPDDSAGSGWSCTLCAQVPTDAGTALAGCETMDARSTANVNRLNGLSGSLSSRWLNRQGFTVDAGAQ